MRPAFFPELGAGGFSRIDSTIEFYQRLNALVDSDFVFLGLDAGGGLHNFDDDVRYRRELQNFRGKVREVIGADVNPILAKNHSLDRPIVVNPGTSIPLPNECVNLIIADFTFEHISDPAFVAGELDRILVPGGWICVCTPNRYGYVALANRLIPEFVRLHG